MKNTDKFVNELIRRSEQFVANVEVWEDYPKDQSYFAISKLLKEVVIPSLNVVKKGSRELWDKNRTTG